MCMYNIDIFVLIHNVWCAPLYSLIYMLQTSIKCTTITTELVKVWQDGHINKVIQIDNKLPLSFRSLPKNLVSLL